MDSKVIAALIGLTGISLGSLLAGVGYYLKSRSERLQTKKNVLFHLLEIRFQLKTTYINPKEITDNYLTYCQDYFNNLGITGNTEFPPELTSIIFKHFESVLNLLKPDISAEFLLSFESSLKDLSVDDPVLAYKLRGRDKLNELLSIQDSYKNDFIEANILQKSVVINELIAKQLSDVSSTLTLQLIEEIDGDIDLFSRKCGIVTWWFCRKILKQKNKPTICFKELGFDDLFNQLLPLFIEAAKSPEVKKSVI